MTDLLGADAKLRTAPDPAEEQPGRYERMWAALYWHLVSTVKSMASSIEASAQGRHWTQAEKQSISQAAVFGCLRQMGQIEEENPPAYDSFR